MREYEDCYAALGVSPEADWTTLRAHYRRLISQWHPDRFAAGSAERKAAEERSQLITAAYQVLDRYRREHGVLPRPPRRPGAPSRPRDVEGSSDRAAFARPLGTDMRGATDATSPKRLRDLRRGLAIGLLFLVAMVYVMEDPFQRVTPAADAPTTAPRGLTELPKAREEPAAAGAQGVFSIGSTIGDVIVIQGVPTLTRGDTWHYGNSEVRFSHGKVVSWKEDPSFPLRIARNQPVQLREGTFKIGSSKDEVREVQGAPVIETATVWDYGLSRVFFEGDRVVHWEESPVQPLRVR